MKNNDYRLARYFINSVQVQSEHISPNEIYLISGKNIEISNKQNLKKKKNRYLAYFSAVGGVAVLLTLIFWLQNTRIIKDSNDKILTNIENVKAPSTEVTDIQLILSDNEILPIEGDNAEIIYAKDGITINNQKKEILANKESEKKQTNYNQLIIPLGSVLYLLFQKEPECG
jgi:hypothetical protein